MRPTLTLVALAAMLLLHPGAHALSLGRMSVHSALGEPLRAEIEITSMTPEEATSVRVVLASPEVFRSLGVEYNAALSGASASVEKRADGRSSIRLTGTRAVAEPFIDVVLDLNWNGGQLQRSYTMLIDPRDMKPVPLPIGVSTAPVFTPIAAVQPASQPAAPVASVPTEPVVAQPALLAASAASAPAAEQPPISAPATRPAAAVTPGAAAQPAAAGQSYRVQRGDTLYHIAQAQVQPGVSLDQMLVALYRANPQAFIGKNMNRLKAGVVLDVTQAQSEAPSVTPAEARRIIQAQSADFSAFRRRLAGMTPKVQTQEPPRQVKGKVEAAVQDRKSEGAPTPPDKLTLSKPAASAVETKVSKQTERKAAQDRVAELNRNVEELKRLSAASAATASAKAAAAVSPAASTALPQVKLPINAPINAPITAPVVAPVAPPPSVAASKPPAATLPVVPAVSAAASAASAAVPVTAPAPEASQPAAAAVAPEAASAAASAAPKPKHVAVPPPAEPVEEPGFFSSLMDSPFTIPLGIGLVALLAGLGFMRLRRRRGTGNDTTFVDSKAHPDSFFGVSGGQRVDTTEAGKDGGPSSLNYSLSQLDAIGDVDPVAEADVYLAYNRDLQAEEILKEALRLDPSRPAVRAKLLEVYAKRGDQKSFAAQARELHNLTGGKGPEWARAVEFGVQVDPANPLFASAVVAGAGAMAPARPAPMAPARVETDAVVTNSVQDGRDLNVDIDLDTPPQMKAAAAARAMPHAAPQIAVPTLKGGNSPIASPANPPAFAPAFAAAPAAGSPFKATLSDAASAGGSAQGFPASRPGDIDFGDLSLDLDPETVRPVPNDMAGVQVSEGPMGGNGHSGADDPLGRKVDLADEFLRIGDKDGARDLLQEVVGQAQGALRERAQRMLNGLG